MYLSPYESLPVTFLNGGDKLVVGGFDRVRLFDLRAKRALRTLSTGIGKTISIGIVADGSEAVLVRASVSRDDGGSSAINVFGSTWSLRDGRIAGPRIEFSRNAYEHAYGIEITRDGSSLIRDTLSTVQVWNAHTGEKRYELPVFSYFKGYSASLDSTLMAVTSTQPGGHAEQVTLVDLKTGDHLRSILFSSTEFVSVVALSPDHKRLAVGIATSQGSLCGYVRIYDTSSGALLGSDPRPGLFPCALKYSDDGANLAVATVKPGSNAKGVGAVKNEQANIKVGNEGEVLLYDSVNIKSPRAMRWRDTGLIVTAHPTSFASKVSGTFDIDPVGQSGVYSSCPLEFSLDEKYLWARTNDKATVWDLPPSAIEGKVSALEAPIYALHPDARTFISLFGFTALIIRDQPLRVVKLDASEGIFAAAFTPDGERLVTGGLLSGLISMWDSRTGRQLASILSISEGVTLPYRSDVPKRASSYSKPIGAASKPIGASSKPIGAATKPIEANSKVPTTPDDFLVVTPQGYYSGSAAADRFVQFRLGDQVYPAECFQARYYRPEIVRRVLEGGDAPPVGDFRGPMPPQVRFVSPANGSRVNTDSLVVNVEARDDSEVRSVSLYLNGARVESDLIHEVNLNATPANLKSGWKRFSAVVPIPPGTRGIKLSAVATDDDDLQSPRVQIGLSCEANVRGTGTLRGLCVGISDYDDPHLRLRFADRDASAIAARLSGQKALYTDSTIQKLLNRDATSEHILSALTQIAVHAERPDTVVLFLSGHGWRDAAGRFYFATVNVNRNAVASTALSWDDVAARLQQISRRCRRVIVLLDACHSGSAATNDDLHSALITSNAGVLVLASSHGTEVSLEVESLRRGVFTQAIVEALESKETKPGQVLHGTGTSGDQSALTLWDFVTYVKKRVTEISNGTQHPKAVRITDFEEDAPIFSTSIY